MVASEWTTYAVGRTAAAGVSAIRELLSRQESHRRCASGDNLQPRNERLHWRTFGSIYRLDFGSRWGERKGIRIVHLRLPFLSVSVTLHGGGLMASDRGLTCPFSAEVSTSCIISRSSIEGHPVSAGIRHTKPTCECDEPHRLWQKRVRGQG